LKGGIRIERIVHRYNISKAAGEKNKVMHNSQRKLVWDIPTRLAHWLMVILIIYSWFAVEILEDMQQHFWSGYGVLCVIMFRIVWGFVGTQHARFINFVATPAGIWRYSKTLFQRNSSAYLGHNPMGGLSALVLILVILLQVSTGLFNSDDYFHAPLSGLVSDATRGLLGQVHALNFTVATILVVLHIAAIIFYKLYKGQALTWSMINGKKPASLMGQSITGSKIILAFIVLILCAGITYYIVTGFTDTLPSSEYDYSF
jgi:cytochrome b